MKVKKDQFNIGDIIGDLKIIGFDRNHKKSGHAMYYFVQCIKCGASTDKNGNPLSMRSDILKKKGYNSLCKCTYEPLNPEPNMVVPKNVKTDLSNFESDTVKVTGFCKMDNHRSIWFIKCKVCGRELSNGYNK